MYIQFNSPEAFIFYFARHLEEQDDTFTQCDVRAKNVPAGLAGFDNMTNILFGMSLSFPQNLVWQVRVIISFVWNHNAVIANLANKVQQNLSQGNKV